MAAASPPGPARAEILWRLADASWNETDLVRSYLERGLAPTDRLALLFLNRWMVEQLLGLGEATQGRVKRPMMRQVLDKVEERLRLVQPPL